jgi:hypothetical protein
VNSSEIWKTGQCSIHRWYYSLYHEREPGGWDGKICMQLVNWTVLAKLDTELAALRYWYFLLSLKSTNKRLGNNYLDRHDDI